MPKPSHSASASAPRSSASLAHSVLILDRSGATAEGGSEPAARSGGAGWWRSALGSLGVADLVVGGRGAQRPSGEEPLPQPPTAPSQHS